MNNWFGMYEPEIGWIKFIARTKLKKQIADFEKHFEKIDLRMAQIALSHAIDPKIVGRL